MRLAGRGSLLSQARALVPGVQAVEVEAWQSTLTSVVFHPPEQERQGFERIEAPLGATVITWSAAPQPTPACIPLATSPTTCCETVVGIDVGIEDDEEICVEEENPCGDCSAGWITQKSLIGGLECEHGPEHDERRRDK